jgi:hypothetical protein
MRSRLFIVVCAAWIGCDQLEIAPPEEADDADAEREVIAEPEEPVRERVDSRPPPMARPVPLYEDGSTDREIDAATADVNGYLLLELGESWTPYLFTEHTNEAEERIPHAYRETYLALARGETPNDLHGDRASRDKYLELFGIMPTLGALRERFRTVRDLECREGLDLSPLERFDGFVVYSNNDAARRSASAFDLMERQVASFVAAQGVRSEAELDLDRLEDRERRSVTLYRQQRVEVEAIRAAQLRLECEGYFEGKGRWVRGALDWATHEALAEFERRHRIYGWGFVGNSTLEALRLSPMELERRAVVRVLSERAMHSLGVLEDGSAPENAEGVARTFRGRDGREHEVPNLEADLAQRIEASLGLRTPELALEFLEGLGELTPDAERTVAIAAPELPEYYDDDMEIEIEIDRGDVWYEFPYDDAGVERAQPVQRRPRLTVYVEHEGHRIPIARFGTTVGGWRSELIEGTTMWRYKNSPIGPRVWHQIVSAPVWLPPESTPSRELLSRVPGRSGAEAFRLNLHETGPSYASAYGLVAAYHLRYDDNGDGTITERGDEGIRTHGSVDYMSIMRRHSHGCHRLHNHIAVRLMSWVLAHRPHRRVGHQVVGFHRTLEHEGHQYNLDVERGGYVFDLERPLRVNVLEGRIRGEQAIPIETPLPRFNAELGAYAMPDGTTVRVSSRGVITPYVLPDAAVPGLDGGVGDPRLAPLTQ